ncbi:MULTISPECIES: MarR family winged helix-turn-helix transcriptional regulator [Bacillota]|jgi:DNA-binding MarR family transcriptional regulator|uniref:MarR family protein n=3 Tax=Paraclostridium bifermentans TaxID=1490 RepID=T4VPX4_PARBF|nr:MULTISPECIES: MarR family transcriptional regulator [Bacillota]KGJ50079.1 MarR family transcriptional regulator [Clostridium sp. NCR]MCU9808853.1 MarR family transcriptional regulator [Paraclostridium sp. AKS46]EQK43573.1 marR family protein [[Clostridium] bifermentans ATCC 638] [Paraclostridium bifermentans ATCC 638 = DSM 14991]EQK46009.1 marR family protein [[Clostridium] bifermentans ATCC 19299] [Paraclostridium bifermentans ATCC 19299]MBS5953099.1 MarR family transcriptional regulator [
MNEIIKEIIDFVSKTFPKIHASLYLESLKEYAANINVNRTQLRALVFINNNGEITMTDLCEKLNIEKGSLTTMVDDLTKKGYLTRTRDSRDRRKYILNLTTSGEEIAKDFLEALGTRLESRFLELNEEDRNKFMDSIKNLEEILIKES